MSLGSRIKEIRKNLGLTQEGFGNEFGVSKMTVSLWEKGEHEPNLETLKKIADMAGISLDYLILGKETDKEKQSEIIMQLRERIRYLEKGIEEDAILHYKVAESKREYIAKGKTITDVAKSKKKK